MDIAIRVGVFLLGAALVLSVIRSAILTFILPRDGRSQITRVLFLIIRVIFNILTGRYKGYERRDSIMALYAPVSLISLVGTWIAFSLVGFMGMYWATGTEDWETAYKLSLSSVFTLGFAPAENFAETFLIFGEAFMGLVLIALLIGYLPTIYSAFSKREMLVTLLEVRAGAPPNAPEMFERFQRIHGFDNLNSMWTEWERWFAELDETHTSLAVLPFYRSPRGKQSWVVAAGAVMDSAALAASTLDLPRDPQADLCIRAGFLALRHIADFFNLPYNESPKKGDPISVTRQEYDAVYDRLLNYGIPMKPDRDKAWEDFAGWRVNYDTVLRVLAVLTMAPEAPWISDKGRIPQATLIPKRMYKGINDTVGKPK